MIIGIIVFLLGCMIGYNHSWQKLKSTELRTLEQVDAQVRQELVIAKNLNESLLKDIELLKKKIARLEKNNG
jgi:hypothetical protein